MEIFSTYISEQDLSARLRNTIEHMQSQIGKSGKTLHEVFSEYLALKAEDTLLADELAHFEIPQIDDFTPEQTQAQRQVIKRLQILRKAMSSYAHNLDSHPWFGLAHPDISTAEMEPIQKTIRFTLIALNRFWIEFASFPSLTPALQQLSLKDAQKLWSWLEPQENWSTLQKTAWLVPALSAPSIQSMTNEFIREVKCIRTLLRHVSSYVHSPNTDTASVDHIYQTIQTNARIAFQYQLTNCSLTEVQGLIETAKQQHWHLNEIEQFFSELNETAKSPKPQTPEELTFSLNALQKISQLPRRILRWRIPTILNSNALIRIQAWKDRAKPLLETKKRLENHFILSSDIDAQSLFELAYHLTHGGPLKAFKTPFKKAKATYEGLLLNPDHAQPESPYQMAEKLTEWAVFLEQSQAFCEHTEAQTLFGPDFKGVYTDFDGAIEAHQWAQQLLQEAQAYPTNYAYLFAQFVFHAPTNNLSLCSTVITIRKVEQIRTYLPKLHMVSNKPMAEHFVDETARLTALESLHHGLKELSIPEQEPLSILADLRNSLEELSFLMHRLDQNRAIHEVLTSFYEGLNTNLEHLEQVLAYIHTVEKAPVPQQLKEIFLSPRGPTRFQEQRTLIATAATSLQTALDYSRKLSHLTHGALDVHLGLAIPQLIERMQLAIRESALLTGYIEYLRCEEEVRAQGLSNMLDFFQKQSLPIDKFEIAYGLVVNGSLLKKAIQN